MVERDDLAIKQHVGKRFRFAGDRLEFVGPVEALARVEHSIAVFDPQLHAVAVELDLMAPALAARRPLDHRAKLRRDEVGHGSDLLRFCRRCPRFRFRRSPQCGRLP